MATAKMKILLPLVVWMIWLHTTTAQSFGGIGFGIKREIFFLNLEDGYFGCQVNESTDVLQLFELSKLCDGTPNCFLGSDELAKELKCTDDCRKDDGTECQNGACLDHLCHCNDGYGGCSCEVPDENECKYRPCDVFAHCTNTLGSFSCTCFPGYQGDGFHCEDINECDDPAIAARCVENAECCNLPAHFLCKCNPGYEGDGEVQCLDIDECARPNACGSNALCHNTPGNYTCVCPEGFFGNPFDGCVDVDECENPNACGPGAICRNVVGGRECSCPPGYDGDADTTGCGDMDECLRNNPCGRNAQCTNLEGSFRCACPPGFIGDPTTDCTAAECNTDLECANDKACINFQCIDPCSLRGACGLNAQCKTVQHRPRCSCPECHVGTANTACHPDPNCLSTQPRPARPLCRSNSDCADELACLVASGECFDPCAHFKCKDNKKCEVHRHRPRCVCQKGFVVNEHGEISCARDHTECYRDEQCPPKRACIEGLCQNPCTASPKSPCPPDKSCDVVNHRPTCICLKNCSPSLSICLRDNGCPLDQACRAFRCEDPCATANCAENSPCYVEDHRPLCKSCAPGYKSDAKYGCVKDVLCQSHLECPTQQACINRKCQNPCAISNPCTKSQDCQVQDHQPVCVKVCQCQRDADCGHINFSCDGCKCVSNQRIPECSHCAPGVPCDPNTGVCLKVSCTNNEDCPITEACIDRACQRPCDVRNPCKPHAVCINTNHGSDCSCEEGFQGNGFVGCVPVPDYKPICQYNEDCPPNKLCDRLNRLCISPCFEDSCGENAECLTKDHAIDCRCLPGYQGNPYISCERVQGCRADSECPSNEACINGQCASPCKCGINAICEVIYHRATCKCPPGYQGDALVGCQTPTNPCEPSPCGINALCELDNGNPICFCPKGLTGNPFKNCIPEGEECSPNPCGPNSGCRVVGGNAVCFCLPEFEGTPPQVPCALPSNPCDPSPCGPNTQCSILSNGFSKCTCLPGFLESPNTIRGCVEATNPCNPNPCGQGAICDPLREPVCICPIGTIGNPFRSCSEPSLTPLCSPGPCGLNADCYVTNNQEQCYCRTGFIGNPYSGCRLEPPTPCTPNPCGPGAQCIVTPDGNPMCRCPDGMGGDPTGPAGCHGYECVVDENCADHQACIGYRCKDPCPGSCGINANCRVEKHHPVCTCDAGLTGNPVIRCFPVPEPLPPEDPCMPNPCGLNTFCQVMSGRAVCSCLPDFQGDPQFGCQPECVINSDCPINKACLNRRCVEPCTIGHLCGINAVCQVRDHTATCICPQGYMGDPLSQCLITPPLSIPTYPNATQQPCVPSPCGTMECSIYGTDVAICNPCLGPDAPYIPQCRPECLTNSECPFDKACLGYSCVDPCPGSCGVNAQCSVVLHTPVCSCPSGLVGDPFQHCTVPAKPDDRVDTCASVRCGANADCKQQRTGLACVCRQGYFGNPWIACRPECVINPDCPLNKACISNKCVDPCPGVCGISAQCEVANHIPICYCPPHYTGDPFASCYKYTPPAEPPVPIPGRNPCDPSPCGPFSRCLVSHQGYATCSCLPNYQGAPPACKPECVVSSDCSQTKACINQKCVDPCTGTCGANALCTVINHNPICSCPPGQQGDPFFNCYTPPTTDRPKVDNPCIPSPCGANSICQVKENRPVCSCIANYIGSPPYCRPECTISEECSQDKSCINEKCVNPCKNLCGSNAKCNVVNHIPLCSCLSGYEGDAFIGCSRKEIKPQDPCNPSPCGVNAQCTIDGAGGARCTCIPPYIGNPYVGGCRPECTMNSECPNHLACLSQHCRDPCQGLCGVSAECNVVNHVPVCTCARGLIGDPFTACREPPKQPPPPTNPCDPSPCGPNSICRVRNDNAICSCQLGYTGAPPLCRPECLVSSECSLGKACINQKCQDPCPGTCGIAARCQVNNHNPICSCPPDYIGDPFVECKKVSVKPPRIDPCIPSPCGSNAECRDVDNRAVCTCLPGMYGTPPRCRPECVIDQDCPLTLSCVGNKCKDPCVGSCGYNAQCSVVNHRPLCSCLSGYEGDPFSGCNLIPPSERTPTTPCFPSPCGPNAECREKNGAGACICPPGYEGDPYDSNKGCHRECESSTDCAPTLACVSYKCIDPCPGTCGSLADCTVTNHVPICTCPSGFTGDPFFQCREIPPPPPRKPEEPCRPSPCGPNSQCRNVNSQAVCSCLPTYIGAPPNCRPECVVSSECPLDRACLNQKCADPCPNTCGLGAQCTTKNHNPICACPPGYTGDPFTVCSPQPVTAEPEPTERPPSCYPSPCGPNSQCKLVADSPSCSCLPDFIGAPPNCRPECVLNTECNNQLTCINQRCKDPCPGSCGINAECHVINHLPICTCIGGHTGDPFTQCNLLPPATAPPPPQDPCNPSPCGPNAECDNGICTCVREYIGNPYESCRPECVLSSECSRDKACIRNKCMDPCPGTCGQNARCDVINHIPTCSCPDGFTGDPFTNCRYAEPTPQSRKDPCNPSPCGPNSQCKNIDDHAVCSCITGYQGSPPSCRPECLVSGECSQEKACVNQKCIDPCPGSCGLQARCEVRNHSPICSCREGQTGDPFQRCVDIPPPPPSPRPAPVDPCEPSPCGPNSICRRVGDTPSCTCQQNYIGNPPNCRPECVINPDCQSTQACINNKCRDPCPGSCGENAECHVVTHTVSCVCSPGFTGNPFVQCSVIPDVVTNPCEPSPCGANAECRQRNGAGACTCIQDYQGNPYEGCRPECVLSSDCPTNKACIRSKCTDPCPGVCGQNAECAVINHVPACTCIQSFVGDPFAGCSPAPILPTEPTVVDPCSPSPCGLYSQCRNVNDQPVCSCLPEYTGSPPNCKPECVVSSECPQDRACHKFKCANPCAGTCGIQARCEVINHSPICTCPAGLTGDPFIRCYPLPPPPPPPKKSEVNPCIPSPCGPNSECRVVGDQPSCSCRVNYIGTPPNCRPECSVNTDCPSELACITEKCRDPCPGSCGFNTECRVQNHIPICTCATGFTGDAFTECTKIEPPRLPPPTADPCNPSPCGQNTHCEEGICSCLPLYHGDPYRGCRPECTMNTDCSPNKSCNNLRCIDPCPGTCGQGAVCDVINHIPACSCPRGFEGDPFTNCRPIKKDVPSNPCQPSPCGPNSVCKVNNGVAVCSCQPGLIGSPPSCRPECVVSAECPLTQACLNSKCVDPCPGTCGISARCQVVNHNPICSCTEGNTGDPFTRCYPIIAEPRPPVNPCDPSPCGPNSVCQVRGESPACSCVENYVGTPPNCRPECTINPECPSTRACVNQKCQDPCPGSCGSNALCNVVNHNSVCSCVPGYTGDPFRGCIPVPETPPVPQPPGNPCLPSPCGPNAHCRVEGTYAVCECLPEYHGNPYESCRPECLTNADCSMNRACITNKCQDPCPGTCGVNALCSVANHIPVCSCPEKYEGDAFRLCIPVTEPPPRDPCNPSPCGINTVCRKSGDNAVCECLPGFFGTPTAGGCKPECTISSDCARDRACVNTKCVDPCPGVCGFGAVCSVVNHSPICSCPPPLVGDPFTLCREETKRPEDPCNPSPCNPGGQCRLVNGAATCIYPECVINQDCPRDKACYATKCRDPCRDACGLNALCQTVNHKAVCSCPSGYVGQPEVHCRVPEEPKRPKVECVQDTECTNDKACIDNRCVNPCSASPGICGQNAECHPQLHRAVCSCRDGFTGNAHYACYEIGCRSDSDCPPTEACINKNCVDPCTFTSCGANAFCRADANHRARCYCPDNFRGDPLIRCERPECTSDQECPNNLACRNERCEDPCNCGAQAVCRVSDHRPQCSCPPGYTGNPVASCARVQEPQPECKMDSDCPSRLACFGGVCKNPCRETKPCGRNAECIVVDSLPLRTMSCMCLPGYVGDADTECKLVPEEHGCKSDSECAPTEACLNRQCVNPCAVGNPCAPTADCTPTNHKAVCRCPSGLLGNPFVKCYEQPKPGKPECTSDSECSNDKACTNQQCQDPCTLASPCGTNALCKTSFHRPTCVCSEGWVGNPQVVCYKPECNSDDDCPYNKACINENCINPCTTRACGRGAECLVQNHRAQCQCPAGTQGDPLLSCITGICHYNEDCADHEACDRLNRVCRPVCEEDVCADTATCVGEQHQPKCRCPAGTSGNPYVQCIGLLPPPEPEPSCRSDSDCPSQQACINLYCVNPCASGNMCTQDQECRVLDTLPLRTVMCQCPADTVVDASGRCVQIKIRPECQVDADCSDKDKCIRGSCIEACKVDNCGVNALCNSFNHLAVCSCAPGYSGNARVECYGSVVTPIPLPLPPECYADSDCTYDKACRGGYCVNPCREDKPCANNAFCSVNNHAPVCKCPAGYVGNPQIECIAPPGPTVGCSSNSECPKSESCINRLCVSPCNCGPNADCKVVNHYATCFCQPGYSGNPQTGCVKLGCQSDTECSNDQQCYNGQCINPCILGDPCARNAECYGNNHRAACKCPEGYEGNAFDRCERVECHTDIDCPSNRACIQQRCVDPCSSIANPPCAHNAICYAQNHAAGCVCPPHLPEGNPQSYCSAVSRVPGKPECELDVDCPSKLACIRNQCVNPCESISPCHPTAHCSVLDTVPVRTMICTCPEGWVPNENGECHAVVVPIPPGCTSDDDCSNDDACINRLCRSPCDCGTNAECHIQNHRAICSCRLGFEGNPNIACHSVGCRIDSECPSGKACINGNCINPCLVKDPCGINAECYVYQNSAECRCISGYRGNPFDRCIVVGCTSNSDCPSDRQCINSQCINPCVYDNPCSSRAECMVHNHLPLCRCPPGLIGNPYVDCKPEPQPECREDSECPARLACLNNKCQDPCALLEPCRRPAECQVVSTIPLRTMICVCPPGYISSGSGTCQPVSAIREACISDSECPADKACFSGICRSPCNCGPNADCRIKDHKPVCTCKQGFEGNPEIECSKVGCKSDDECSGQHSCINRQCVPVCAADGSSCGDKATCYGFNHRAICDCPPGLMGNPKISCVLVGCRSDSECPGNRACINNKCELPCETANPCDSPAECKVYNHIMECVCPPGTVSDGNTGCTEVEKVQKCRKDHDCPSHHACIGGECVNPCKSTEPCGVNAECTVLDTEPVRTMICQCPPGYQGNAAVQCDKMAECRVDKGLIRTPDGKCVCPPNTALNENDECIHCPIEKGLKVDERGRCVCALERGLIIDERGKCVCPIEFGYHLDLRGNCVSTGVVKCEDNDQCAPTEHCNPKTKQCENNYRVTTEFPRPDLLVSCLSDGVQVEIALSEIGFDGILYVKGHSKDENCRRIISIDHGRTVELFKVKFGTCGLIHINGEASFVLVIQKHPKLLTYRSQAYHIKCVYQTGEQNVTLGFNVSMLTTAGTIANTGPPPTCLMKIVTPSGEKIDSAEIGDNLVLQVDVEPGFIYGGFARSCVAKTMDDNVENEYLVTDENGCATDPTIFGEWEYNSDTQSLLASFNAFKFPSSDNIRFQCNIRVCFGKCQPVNCRGYNAFGRRKRAIDSQSENNTDVALGGDLLAGQLREEITIQSNAILTIERREEKGPGPQTAPNSQRVEDICVSMIEFIIGLVITALLALVAVAVAVSCWLMAIRRRPKATGPLPHPPEFPNPLFTTPEPMAEPSPDYLT